MATVEEKNTHVQPEKVEEDDTERNANSTEKHVDGTLEQHAHDADEAFKALQEMHGEAFTLDDATNKRLLRIIDWHLMPIMCCVYGMNYLDSMMLRLLFFFFFFFFF